MFPLFFVKNYALSNTLPRIQDELTKSKQALPSHNWRTTQSKLLSSMQHLLHIYYIVFIQIAISPNIEILCVLHILCISRSGVAILREQIVGVARCRRLGIAAIDGILAMKLFSLRGNTNFTNWFRVEAIFWMERKITAILLQELGIHFTNLWTHFMLVNVDQCLLTLHLQTLVNVFVCQWDFKNLWIRLGLGLYA